MTPSMMLPATMKHSSLSMPFLLPLATGTSIAPRRALSSLTPSTTRALPTATSEGARRTPTTTTTATTTLRYQSTYQRTKKRLRVKPDATFGTFPSSGSPSSPSPSSFGHIFYNNPPPSAPNVLHTPTKFLPQNDLRLQLRRTKQSNPQAQAQAQAQAPEQHDASVDATKLPLLFPHSSGPGASGKTMNAPYATLDRAAILEIRRLRTRDPLRWSRTSLAKKFNCSAMFIAQVCEASPEKREVQRKLLEAVRATWGKKRTAAREDRALRKEVWARDS